MPGTGTQCGSLEFRPALATRPSSSSTRTELALQGRHRPGTVSSACLKRASRTVKYCAPWSNVPKALSRVAMRPPTPRLFSNTVTWCPACTRVRAQAMPARPAPMTAKCLALNLDSGGAFLGWVVRMVCVSSGLIVVIRRRPVVHFTRPGGAPAKRPGWPDFPVASATIAGPGPGPMG